MNFSIKIFSNRVKKFFVLFLSKIKKFFFRWRRLSWKIKLFWGSAVFVTLLLLYFSLALLSVGAAELKLAALKESWEKEIVCHEECARERLSAKEMIVEKLAADSGLDSRLARRLEEYFLAENLPLGFRRELVAILRTARGQYDLPSYLADYLGREDGQALIKVAIIDFYGEAFVPEYHFNILAGANDSALKQASVRALSAYQDREAVFSAEQVVLIGDLAISPQTDIQTMADLVLLLADYQPLFPLETEKALRTIYRLNLPGREIGRALAADILNRVAGEEEWPLPEVSQAQWDEYYRQ
ncbi:MAG: hypothetical protein WC146_02335 [Patescibacteria group bacterium]|jgi:hypothetical protein